VDANAVPRPCLFSRFDKTRVKPEYRPSIAIDRCGGK
jgi:hypothetical protein